MSDYVLYDFMIALLRALRGTLEQLHRGSDYRTGRGGGADGYLRYWQRGIYMYRLL